MDRPNPYPDADPEQDQTPVVADDPIDPIDPLPPWFLRGEQRVWPTLLVIPISLVAFLTTSVIALIVAVGMVHGVGKFGSLNETMIRDATMSPIGFPLVVVVPQLALVTPCVLAAFWSRTPMASRLGLRRGTWPIWSWFAAMLATPLVGLASGIVFSLLTEESDHLKEMADIFRQLGGDGYVIPLALLIGLTPAVCEELLFRGYVQTRLTQGVSPLLRRAGWEGSAKFGPLIAIVFASFCFAAFHFDFVHAVTVLPIGLFLGWISYRSGSLFPAMMGHFLNNVIGVVMTTLAPEGETDIVTAQSAAVVLLVLVGGMAGLIGVVIASFVSTRTAMG